MLATILISFSNFSTNFLTSQFIHFILSSNTLLSVSVNIPGSSLAILELLFHLISHTILVIPSFISCVAPG